MFRRFCYRTLLALMVVILCVSPSMASPKVGVVLGGGAARGFSHIGLLKAFEENGIPVDLLVGTSMGSIISSFYAAGYSIENMQQIVTSLDIASLIDLSIPPQGGFIDTSRLQHYLDILLQHKSFDQLAIPFYSVITNVLTGEEVALNKGLVSTGVQASMSIPVLFPPVMIDDQYYVDGGMKNAVPANVARDKGADVIIAVDVKKELENIDHDSVFTNMQLSMWFMIDGYVQLNTSMADVIVVPEVKYDSYMDYQKVEKFIEEGYLAGLAHMDQIKAAILEQDPEFQFIPYTQTGLSRHEVAALMALGDDQVADLPRTLRITPEITMDPLETFPQLGLRFEHGFLSRFSLGYRYGFHQVNGGHELFLDWKKDRIGTFSLFIRKTPKLSSPTWGADLSFPISEQLGIRGVYLNSGNTQWQLSSSYRGLIESKRWSLDLNSTLTRKRTGEDALFVSLNPMVKLHLFPEPQPLFEIALARPHVYVGAEVSSPTKEWDVKVAYELGLGSEFQLFGLYPIETSVGIKFQEAGDTSWRFKVIGGDF